MILSFSFYVAVSVGQGPSFLCVFTAFNPGYSRGAEILWWENYNIIHNSGNSNIASSTSLFGGHDLGESHKGVMGIF